MNDPTARAEANQAHLVHELDRVRRLLEARLDGIAASSGTTSITQPTDTGSDAAIEAVVHRFGLSGFERDVLLMAAGTELDSRFGALLGRDGEIGSATFGTAMAAFPDAHWSALSPDRPLRGWRLIDLVGPGVTGAHIRIDERILHFLAGVDHLDERLRGLLEPVRASEDGGNHAHGLASDVAAVLDARDASGIAQIVGGDAPGRLDLAVAAGRAGDAVILRLRGTDVPESPVDRRTLAILAAREWLLAQRLVVLDMRDRADERAALAYADATLAPLVICADEPLDGLVGRATTFELHSPDPAERLIALRAELGSAAARLDGSLTVLADQFELGRAQIRAIVAQTRDSSRDDDNPTALWDAARRIVRPRLDGLAQRVEALAGWDDLVLPEAHRRTLRSVAVHVRNRRRVHEEWGFAAKSVRGLGITALFAGPSGTGKTMAGEVLARELRLDLYRIDLATVVSKYIGETEKNLKRLFDAAEGSGAILLFDEADALFGKRSEVRDSHDRYANLEVSYLLQRMEAYRGLAILTSNQKTALDPAFLRRIRFIVHFPFPDAEARAEIWRGAFPSQTPVAELDHTRLAQLNLAGGHIRNIALAGAFLAADRSEPVRMGHLAEAARDEYAKLERPLSDAETRGWA